MEKRFRKRLWVRRLAAVTYLLGAAIYLSWRLTIINDQAPFLSWMYFTSDVIAALLGAVTIFVSWHYRHRRSPPAPSGLSVDVLIPTYREPVDMVRRTVKAAMAIRYSHETWLLDDGDRPEMRDLAEEIGCRYLARADNAGAKAGNLNHALGCTTGEFIAVFDADHVPQANALDATLGFFADAKVGMVQTPQDYFNVDALQYMNARNGGLWHDQSFFYNLSQPGRDHHDAASCAGTSVVYRRSALEAIGGIPDDTVTEDVHTSLKLHKAGFSVPFLNEPIAFGIAAADLGDYYRTRLRYGHGNIHALRRENILFCRGLTLQQRLSYLFLGLIYLEGWQQLMVFLVPAIALIFGIAPFEITILNVLIVLLYPLVSYLLMQEVGCGFSRYWTAEVFSMMRFPVHLIASLALVRNRLAWRPSQKNVAGRFELVLLAPQIAVLVLSLTAVVIGFQRLEGRYEPGPLVAAVTDRLPDPRVVAVVAGEAYDTVASLAQRTGEQVVAMLPQETAPAEPDQEATGAPAAGEGATAPVVAVAPPAAGTEETVSTEAATEAPTEEVPATEPVPEPEPVAVPRPAPAPIDWFQPLTRGYTIDLVLIAGFWALFNALRVVFVIAKVALNAHRSRSDYLFRTLVPVAIETPGKTHYLLAERMSETAAVLTGKAGALARLDGTAGLRARAFVPGGTINLVLHPAPGGRRGRSMQVRIGYAASGDRQRLDDALHDTRWQRECLNNDAEFLTPLGWLWRLLRLDRSDRAPWRAALVLDDASEHLPALIKPSGELLIAAERPPAETTVRVVTVGRNGSQTRTVVLDRPLDTSTLQTSGGRSLRLMRYATTAPPTAAPAKALPKPSAAPARHRDDVAVVGVDKRKAELV